MKILFEDKHCLVVHKPARLLTASDKTGDETLVQLVRAYHSARQDAGKKGYVAPLHMLDRPVSGVVMFAVSSKAATRLAEQLRRGKVEKIYRAVVEGQAPAAQGELTDWLLKDHKNNVVRSVPQGTQDAKLCRLDYRVLGFTATGLTVVEIRPKSGRSHQIRVQLASRGMPIYGDRKYGARGDWRRDDLAGVIALHAVSLTFAHPISKEMLTIESPIPDYFPPLVRVSE